MNETEIEDENDDLLEDLNKLYSAAVSGAKYYVIRRFCDSFDQVTRFGNRDKVGTVANLVVVDTVERKFKCAWRGDSELVGMLKKDKKIVRITREIRKHEAIGGVTLEVGRFLGAQNQEQFYSASHCRETDECEGKLDDYHWLILMTDGFVAKWQEFFRD